MQDVDETVLLGAARDGAWDGHGVTGDTIRMNSLEGQGDRSGVGPPPYQEVDADATHLLRRELDQLRDANQTLRRSLVQSERARASMADEEVRRRDRVDAAAADQRRWSGLRDRFDGASSTPRVDSSSPRFSPNTTAMQTVILPRERKMKRFSGSGAVDVEEFIEEMESVLVGQNWSAVERARFVISHLDGDAKLEVKACGVQLYTARDVFMVLRSAFGDRRPISHVMCSFLERKQRPNESVRSFANELFESYEAVKRRQHELPYRVDVDVMLKEQFVQGLSDKVLMMQIRKQNGLDFFEARRFAIGWEQETQG